MSAANGANMSPYKRCTQLGIPVHSDGHVAYVWPDDIEAALAEHGMDYERFNERFGVQTCPLIDGRQALYPWDVEAVLEYMISGRRTGTQLCWD